MPAMWGAEADVPKNGLLKPPAPVMATPSMPLISGLTRVSCEGKKCSTGPCELYGSIVPCVGSLNGMAALVSSPTVW